ncbi:MAG: hypothetical protein AAFN93_07730 [Bacteroidota bacterium]
MHLKPKEEWWDKFIEQNRLEIDTQAWNKPTDAPDWFRATESMVRYKDSTGFDQDSRYFKDQSTGECFIYEIQL